MKSIITILFCLFAIICNSQNLRTNYGPNIGIISNSKEFKENTYEFGFSVRRINRWRYIQPEVNLTWNSQTSEFSQMRIPILFGVKAIRLIRVNVGAELRSDLTFIGENKRGMNQLSYKSNPMFVTPIAGVGLDIDKLCFDLRVTTADNNFVDITPQYMFSISYLFGPRK
jgi:hypothetical protein